MDKAKQRYSEGNPMQEHIPTILVQTPSDELPFVDDGDGVELTRKTGESQEAIGGPERRVSLRRNSISLPNLDDLDRLRRLEAGGRIDSAITSEIETSDDEEFYNPKRNARRKSVSRPRMLRPPGDDDSDNNSPANSITSINSLASLLREKMQMLPATFKKKKATNYPVKIFVALLFIAIICIVSAAYALYQRKVSHKSYFESIKLNKAKRIMKVFDYFAEELAHVKLGVTLNDNNVHPCLAVNAMKDGSECFEWMKKARLYLKYYEMYDSVKCYNVRWVALDKTIEPTDCFDMSSAHWYGGGQTAENAWPLEKGGHDFAPFITGSVDKHQWGNVLKRYFINSNGVAIIIDDKVPLYVSIAGETTKELCLRAKFDDFAYVNRQSKTPELNYSICTNPDMFELNSYLMETVLWDGLKKEDIANIHSLFTEPLWEITSETKDELTEDTISNYTLDVIQLGFLKQGHVLVQEWWQNQVGDFSVDSDRFPMLQETVEAAHRRGFRVVFSVQPFISTESSNFVETVNKGLLVAERHSDQRIPALTRYKFVQSAGVLDITNNKTVPWLLGKLKEIKDKYKFDAYYFDFGTAYDMPHYYHCQRPLVNPDKYKTAFLGSFKNTVSVFGVNSAVELPRAPAFVSLPPFESSWDGLQRVVPTILTYGITGYPFLIPGAVGGDYANKKQPRRNDSSDDLLPDKELYMRWLQLATFLPVIRFTRLPSTYGDEKVLEMAKILTTLRQQKVTPMLKKYSSISLDTGLPLIRPLWMLDSSDIACHSAIDQFSIGEELIVAPIVHAGVRSRQLYLPAGLWKDGISGSLRKGSRWLHDYDVDENKIAYFERLPDDTKF